MSVKKDMLLQLSISNYALIEELRLRPAVGLSVITGETGAGKSILLGALNLLLGQRNLGGKILLYEQRKCVIEGTFDVSRYELEPVFVEADVDYDREMILRRELLPEGKSRAFVNDTPVGLDFVRSLGERLIDIHSQHEMLLLSKSNFQRQTIDSWAGNQLRLLKYKKAFLLHKETKSEYEDRKEAWAKRQSRQDYAEYQLKELQEAQLDTEEQPRLEERLKWLQNQESRVAAHQQALSLLQENSPSLLQQLSQLSQTLEELTESDKDIQELHTRTESTRLELKDIAETLEKHQLSEVGDTSDIEKIEDRLHLIYSLQKKHRCTNCEELLQLQISMEEEAAHLQQEEAELELSRSRLQSAKRALSEAANELSCARKEASSSFAEAVSAQLQALGMPHGRFRVEQSSCSFQKDGADQLTFLFSANVGVSLQPLAKVASGGERSRLMFIIKHLLSTKQVLPTLIFDEIDTGISGETAKRMIDMVQQISKEQQVLLISHLPQFAAKADTHFFIYKETEDDRTVSKVQSLNEEERVEVLAQMLDGENPSKEALQNARSMRHT